MQTIIMGNVVMAATVEIKDGKMCLTAAVGKIAREVSTIEMNTQMVRYNDGHLEYYTIDQTLEFSHMEVQLCTRIVDEVEREVPLDDFQCNVQCEEFYNREEI